MRFSGRAYQCVSADGGAAATDRAPYGDVRPSDGTFIVRTTGMSGEVRCRAAAPMLRNDKRKKKKTYTVM